MKRFFDRPDTQWRSLTGALHLYALPDPSDPVIARTSKEGARIGRWPGLALQPPLFLHMTLQRLDLYREDMDQMTWNHLLEGMKKVSSDLDPFTVEFARPCIRETAIEALGTPVGQWHQAVTAIRGAMTELGLGSSLTDEPFGPHYTFAYCQNDTSSREDAQLGKALERVCKPHSWRVDTLHLVAVEQRPDEGVFRFERLYCWPLGI